MSGNAERLRAVARGRVQGVGFRDFVLQRARQAGLTGWVRNLADGGLECVAEGPRPALERLLSELQSGPPMARVEQVESVYWPAQGDLRGFEARF